MANKQDEFDRILGVTTPDIRDTDDFESFVEMVFSEISAQNNNAKYATLTGRGAIFYKVVSQFGLAIERLVADKRITPYRKDGAIHFRVGGLKVEPNKPLPQEVFVMRDVQVDLTRCYRRAF